MQENPPPQNSRPNSKPPYLFLIPVAAGLIGFIGYQTVRMGTGTTTVTRTPYAIDTSVAQAVVQNGVITVHATHRHPHAATQPQRVAETIATDAPSATPIPSPTPSSAASASAAPSQSPSPKPKATHAPKVAKIARPGVRHTAAPSDEQIATEPVPHIQRVLAARTIAAINVGREQPSSQNTSEAATTPPITDAPSVRTAPVETAKPVQIAEAPHQAEAPAIVNAADRIVEAKMVYAAAPDYPEIARDQGVRGTSVVFVTVDPSGSIVHISIASSSGNSTLDRSAVSAARNSRYAPPKVDGKSAIETYRVTYDFAP